VQALKVRDTLNVCGSYSEPSRNATHNVKRQYLAFHIVIRKALDSLLHVDCIDYSWRHW